MGIIKEFTLRWSDLDANMHISHTAYSNLMIEVRTHYFKEIFNKQEFQHRKNGPVLLHEKFFYLQEIFAFEKVYVELELRAKSDDYMFVEFAQSIYNAKGEQAVYAEILCAWMDLEKRKLQIPPETVQHSLLKLQGNKKIGRLEKGKTRYENIPNKSLNL